MSVVKVKIQKNFGRCVKKGDNIKLENFLYSNFKNLWNDISITVNAEAEQWCKNNVTTEPIYAELD